MEEQLEIFCRGTAEVLTTGELKERLMESRPLKVKFGVDPTAPDIHLGHTVSLHKLRQMQKLGHEIQLIIGDYTAMIGDPSGCSETRPMLTKEQVAANMASYTTQVFKILDREKTKLLYNSQWLGSFSSEKMLELASKYTVQQVLQRRDFGKRVKSNKPLSLAEILYPLLVGYDSVHLKSDVEIGGTDQLFNFMTSRDVQHAYGLVPEVVITLPLLEGLDGVRKMSKSLGNAIGVDDAPDDIYGKIMSISDKLMIKYYTLLSDASIGEIRKVDAAVQDGTENPMLYKQKLAREIVSRYHGEAAAGAAEEKFAKLHIRRETPGEIERMEITYALPGELQTYKIIVAAGAARSYSEARRLIEQGGVTLNGSRITDPNFILDPEKENLLQVGRRYSRTLKLRKA